MADRFEKNPTIYVDMNDLFPVINERVGLNYEQVRAMIENSNYLKTHLVSGVAVGNTDVFIVDNIEDKKLEVTAREETVNGQKVTYLDFALYIPAGQVKSVNGKTGEVVLTAEDLGIEIDTSNLVPKDAGDYHIENSTNGINIYFDDTQEGTVSGLFKTKGIEVNDRGVILSNYSSGSITDGSEIIMLSSGRPVLLSYAESEANGGNFPQFGSGLATLHDIENAIGNVSALLGDTDDLGV